MVSDEDPNKAFEGCLFYECVASGCKDGLECTFNEEKGKSEKTYLVVKNVNRCVFTGDDMFPVAGG